MKKETEKKALRTCVQYGERPEIILPPGHKVFECNLETGDITEAKMVKIAIPLGKRIKHALLKNRIGELDKRPRYFVADRDGFLCLPAHDLYKAKVKFKNVLKEMKIKIKTK